MMGVHDTLALATTPTPREQMNIVVVGHVDHGKSTVIGRLLADTGSLPEGKLQQVQAHCARNARPFEFAFLLDALKDEQAQGITIDSARCFFRTDRRDYIIIDAPGHIEFLKNMVSGAARAEAALLVIDAHEGIRENSRRHGTMLSMLGVRQVVVLVNKMDLVGYDLATFRSLQREYEAFLERLGLEPAGFVPISARDGVNLAARADWYKGPTVLEHLDAFAKEDTREHKALRLPLQDVYKFTEGGDDRRILAGSIEAGSIAPGDSVQLFPSGKRTAVQTIEAFGRRPPARAVAGEAVGFTMAEEIYARPGEIVCRAGDPRPHVSSRLRVSLFWMGRAAMIKAKRYKLKLAAARVPVHLAQVLEVMDASDLSTSRTKQQVERHDVATCILETAKPVAFDLASDVQATGRFVIVDNYEIAGGGIVLEALGEGHTVLDEHVARREAAWETGAVALKEREARNGHRAKLVVLVGASEAALHTAGSTLERRLFQAGCSAYYFGMSNLERELGAELLDSFERRAEAVRRLGEVARILTDSGHIAITTVPDVDRGDLEMLRTLNAPQEILTVQLVGQGSSAVSLGTDVVVVAGSEPARVVEPIISVLEEQRILPEYCI